MFYFVHIIFFVEKKTRSHNYNPKLNPRIVNKTIKALQNSVDELSLWLLRLILSISLNKNEAKIKTLRKYLNQALRQINNQEIQRNSKYDSLKYLGVYLDEKLTWKININKTLN